MIVTEQEKRLFFELYIPLLGYANKYDETTPLRKRDIFEVRDMLWNNPQIMRDYMFRNPNGLNNPRLEIISNWQRFVRGDFVLIRSLKKYAVLLTVGKDVTTKAYGVLGLSDPIIEMADNGVGTIFRDLVLLPFNNRIIWDGLSVRQKLLLGKNIMSDLTDAYRKINKEGKIVESI
jgi:hypothetical protein